MKNISGDQLFQKKYTTDTLPVRQMLNKGEREQYYYSQRHEPIISREDFDKVQKILNEHKKSFKGIKIIRYAGFMIMNLIGVQISRFQR